MRSIRILAWLPVLGAMALTATSPFVAAPFPADTPPSVVETISEASGIVWHPWRQKLYVVDDGGRLHEMNADGSGEHEWSGLGDIEGVTYADAGSDFVYVAREGPEIAILEFDVVQEEVTREFDLGPWIDPANPNLGMEAITFVPDNRSTEGGYFYAGVQEDGAIYVFELPIQSSTTATTVSFVESFTPNPARDDLSGLDYDRLNEVLFVLWDSAERFAAYRLDRTLIEDWDMYTDNSRNQEGIAVDRATERLFSTEDDGGEIYAFTGFTAAQMVCTVPEVTSLSVGRAPGTQLSWADLGPVFVYDVIGGDVSTLRLEGDASGASCLANDSASLWWDDPRPDPVMGEAYYYLLRGERGCGAGSYGSASSGAERQPVADCS